MKNKFFGILFTVLGFILSVGFPVWALSSQVTLLRADCGISFSERLGLTFSGFIVILLIIFLNFWKYFSSFLEKRLKSGRTPLAFFGVGYLVILAIGRLFSILEVIFLFGAIGSLSATLCYKVADIFFERGKCE